MPTGIGSSGMGTRMIARRMRRMADRTIRRRRSSCRAVLSSCRRGTNSTVMPRPTSVLPLLHTHGTVRPCEYRSITPSTLSIIKTSIIISSMSEHPPTPGRWCPSRRIPPKPLEDWEAAAGSSSSGEERAARTSSRGYFARRRRRGGGGRGRSMPATCHSSRSSHSGAV